MITKSLLEFLIKDAEQAMSEDEPKSTCAAYHRGQIAAYRNILSRLPKSKRKSIKKQKKVT